jgi:serine/threonine-protein kinase
MTSTDNSPPRPRSIGRYVVERLLGQGGMGRVWLARDTVLGRNVAIKVLRDDLALPPKVKEELIERMRHEARAAAAVSHPNIVTLYDMGEDPVVGLFLVFEYVTTANEDAPNDNEGIVLSLRDRLKTGPLSFPDVAKLARELGSALTFAHEAGVIHRDVKPENILFSRTGFKIADFGIARIPDSTITHANMILGTPAYTAPEALSLGEFAPASDQFSLAATIYETVTGGRAFFGDDAIQTAGKVSSEPPPPLHESLAPEAIVRTLDATLQRGLAKTPEARFASCAEFGQAVARAIENTATVRRSASSRSALPTPIPALIEVERSPLSSRLAIVEKAITEHANSSTSLDVPSPSIYLRRQTHRSQNIATAVALLVIVALVILGKRTPNHAEVATAPSASASTEPVQTTTPKLHPKPRPPPPKAVAIAPLPEDAGVDGDRDE